MLLSKVDKSKAPSKAPKGPTEPTEPKVSTSIKPIDSYFIKAPTGPKPGYQPKGLMISLDTL